MGRKVRNTLEFFWTKVHKLGPDECWEWLGSKDKDGYGRYNMKPTRYGAHRISYQIENGTIPPGQVICHTCDNPGCVNPKHLFAGTQLDNIKDMDNKGRRGHRAW